MKTTLYVSYCTCFIKLLRLHPNALHACAHTHIHVPNPHTSVFPLHKRPCAFAHASVVQCLFTLKFMQLPSIWLDHVRGKISYGPDVNQTEQYFFGSGCMSECVQTFVCLIFSSDHYIDLYYVTHLQQTHQLHKSKRFIMSKLLMLLVKCRTLHSQNDVF